MSTCIVCLDLAADTKLSPCNHLHLCAACTIRLDRPVCPSCRSNVIKITFPNGKKISFDQLIKARTEYDDRIWASTVQIVISASAESEYASTCLRDRLTKLYPLSKPPGSGSLKKWTRKNKGRWRRPFKELSRFITNENYYVPAEENQKSLFGFPYRSIFEPNARVDGIPVRFQWCRVPPRSQTQFHTRSEVEELSSFRPDFLLLTCALPHRINYLKMINWDRTLRRVLGREKMPKRMWIFLKPPRFQPPITNIDVLNSALTDMQEDIYDGFNSMMKHERPLTHHILIPDSAFTKTIRTIATRSVFHARQFREISFCPNTNPYVNEW